MGNYDERITHNSNWRRIIRNVVSNIFRIETDFSRIYIDLNSCLSILFRYENVNDNNITDELTQIFEQFLTKYISKHTQIVILWTLEKSSLHTSIYPGWCQERYNRVNISKSNFLKTLLVALNEYSKNTKLVKIINTHDIHPALVVRYLEIGNRRSKSIVLSKDVVFQTLNMNNVAIFTGVDYIDFTDNERPLPDGIELEEPEVMLKYYLAIRGDMKHNEYPGVEKYGPKKSLDYVTFHKLEILAGCDHVLRGKEESLKEVCDKYSVLFDVNALNKLNTRDIGELISNRK